MDRELLRRLSAITAEEARILDGGTVDLREYASRRGNEVALGALSGQGQLIQVRPHTRFAPFPRHRHDFVEILYMASGSTTHHLAGEPVTVKQGELLFLGRNTWHAIEPAGRGDVGVNFLVQPAFFHTAFDLLDESGPLSDFLIHCLTGGGSGDEFLHFPAADVLPVQNLVENLIYTIFHRTEDADRIMELTMGLLLLHLLRLTDRVQAAGGGARELALRALAYLEHHYADASLSAFAAANHVPDYTASRAIKAQLGQNFQQLLQDRRLTAAARMLTATHLPVAEVIAAVGYENTGHFYRAFREKFGVSPKEFRQQELQIRTLLL